MSDDEQVKKQLEDLKSQRANTKGCITRIKTLINSKADTLSATELECRLGILESYWKFILAHQSSIERLSPDDVSNSSARGELEDLYCEIKSKILSLLPSRNRASITDGNITILPASSTSSKLPPLKLPQFSGKYSDYPNFIATFNKLVHDDAEKTITEKYNHLLSCVSGPALRAIESLGKSAITYTQALDKLKERFDNKHMIVQEHIIELFELPKVVKGSALHLRNLVDNISAHFSALRALGSDSEILHSIIVHLANLKLDPEAQSRWEEAIDYTKFPTWEECEKILSRRCQFLEGREKNCTPTYAEQNKAKVVRSVAHKNLTSLKVTSDKCSFCSELHHNINGCAKFNELPVNERLEAAKRLALCINCLRKGHTVKSCHSSKCRVCFRPHHTKLHRYPSNTGNSPSNLWLSSSKGTSSPPIANLSPNVGAQEQSVVSGPSSLCSAARAKQEHVFLATAIINIKDKYGCYHLARVLLYSASQLNFITTDLAQKLGLKRRRINADINGIGDISAKVMYEVDSTIKSRTTNYQTDVHMWVLPSITGVQPEHEINIKDWNIPPNLELADPSFHKPQPIDLLIGADKFFELLSVGQIRLNKNLPTLQKNLFGWIICGTYKVPSLVKQICNLVAVVEPIKTDPELTSLVEKFWSIENFDTGHSQYNHEQQHCEDLFLETVKRMQDGRFMVKLPFKKPPSALGRSFDTALRRLLSLEKRFQRNPTLKQEYVEFLSEYHQLDHMELLRHDQIAPVHYYLPHSCVLRPESSSTRLRVVFDASSQTSSQISLNDIMMVGPTVQNDLYTILLRFRCHRYALTADVSKMYRQILVDPEDTNFQYILWRNQTTGELQTFRLKTVTYGTASAPYLATRCLNYLAQLNSKQFPLASKIIQNDFYVDDLLSGADTLEDIYKIQSEVKTVLLSGQFTLRKWYSNEQTLLEKISIEDHGKPINIDGSDIIKTLGIAWDPVSDEFLYKYRSLPTNKITKRAVLAEMSRLFDPMGLVNPIIVKAKIFLQELWLLSLQWDESLPQDRHSSWIKYLQELETISSIRIPRFILTSNTSILEVHGFCDASTRAYGGCIYLRSIDNFGKITVNLFTGKSKVAPTKIVRTLPCLELCGAELLAKLSSKVQHLVNKPVNQIYLWTDSQIVLGWLASHASTWKPFVANRVSTIQELTTNAIWRYVPTQSNPADMLSRGVTVNELCESFWFTGPTFLYDSHQSWPDKKIKTKEELPEKKKWKTVLTCSVETSFLELINKHSYSKTRRIFAYVIRFITSLKGKFRSKGEGVVIGPPTPSELEAASIKIIWAIQQHEFPDDINSLRHSNEVKSKSLLNNLNPFLDDSGLLRVGGRLRNAEIPYEAKCPILLPKNNMFVKAYIQHLHLKNFHAGPQALVALIRREFWIVNARDYARKIVRNCVHCFKYKPKLLNQIMGDLPEKRVKGSQAFENVGVDFCGPFSTTYKIRGKQPYKSYIAVFVCFLTKGVHLELVSDLTSEAFIATLKRFVSRRRICKHLYCDNATNFVGAQRLLKEFKEKFLDQQIQQHILHWCSEEGITFHHIPPRSPHFGGLWEAAVRSAKSHLHRTLQTSLLTFEELTTVCCQIEAILNSRPLCQLSSDPNDEEALTPAHFWNQAPLHAIPEPDISSQKVSLVSRWRQISLLQQHFWKRWASEYLLALHQRYKWKFSSPAILINSLVLVADDNLPPQRWLLGRIINLIEGKDGTVRVADVHTKTGVIRRVIHKLAPLPTSEEEN